MLPAEDRVRLALDVLEAIKHDPLKTLVLVRVVLLGADKGDVYELIGMYDDPDYLEQSVNEWAA